MAEKKYIMCLKLGCLTLLWPSGLVCKLGGTPLPVIGETEVKFMDADAPLTGATWTDQCCLVSIDDIIIYSRNAVEHIYHIRLVSKRLSEAGMKIKPDDGKQNSMTLTYSS